MFRLKLSQPPRVYEHPSRGSTTSLQSACNAESTALQIRQFCLYHRPLESNAKAYPLSVARPSPQTIAHHLNYQSWASEDAASYRSSLGRAQRGGWRRANLTCSPLTERGGDSWHRGGGGEQSGGSLCVRVIATYRRDLLLLKKDTNCQVFNHVAYAMRTMFLLQAGRCGAM